LLIKWQVHRVYFAATSSLHEAATSSLRCSPSFITFAATSSLYVAATSSLMSVLRCSPSQRLRRFMLQRHRRSCQSFVVHLRSDFVALCCRRLRSPSQRLRECLLCHDVVCRDKVPRLTSTSLASEFKSHGPPDEVRYCPQESPGCGLA
jgi:hypothetical protein